MKRKKKEVKKTQSFGLGRLRAPETPKKRPRRAGLEQPMHLNLIFLFLKKILKGRGFVAHPLIPRKRIVSNVSPVLSRFHDL
jgi:hypothetical protein